MGSALGSQLGLLFVVSEETDHSGMKRANELELKPQYLIVGEPTGMYNKLDGMKTLESRRFSHPSTYVSVHACKRASR